MPYIIDGHNLIAAMSEIDLQDPDDERAIIERLAPFAAREAVRIHLYFDRGVRADRKTIKVGRITVKFVVPPRTADDAIHAHLRKIGAEAPNWSVVSSDREIREHAEALGAHSFTSAEFIGHKLNPADDDGDVSKPNMPLSSEDVERWEALFRRGSDNELSNY